MDAHLVLILHILTFLLVAMDLSRTGTTSQQCWSTTTLSVMRYYHASATVGDVALFGGGNNGTSASNRVDIFDVTSGTWTTATLSQARHSFSGTSVGDVALFGGGTNSTGGT